MILCDAVDALPQPSVAVHVRVTLNEPAHPFVVVTLEDESVNAEPQASEAVAVANEGTAGQLMVLDAGSDAMTGAVTS